MMPPGPRPRNFLMTPRPRPRIFMIPPGPRPRNFLMTPRPRPRIFMIPPGPRPRSFLMTPRPRPRICLYAGESARTTHRGRLAKISQILTSNAHSESVNSYEGTRTCLHVVYVVSARHKRAKFRFSFSLKDALLAPIERHQLNILKILY